MLIRIANQIEIPSSETNRSLATSWVDLCQVLSHMYVTRLVSCQNNHKRGTLLFQRPKIQKVPGGACPQSSLEGVVTFASWSLLPCSPYEMPRPRSTHELMNQYKYSTLDKLFPKDRPTPIFNIFE